jgi:hypothetical protein
MRNGLAFLLLGLSALGLGTASCGSDEATNGSSCKRAGETFEVVKSVNKGSCCAGLAPQCNTTPTTDPNTQITYYNGSCTCQTGNVLGGGGTGGSTGGTGGTSAGTGGTGGGAMSSALGRACTMDAQCGTGLTCLTNDGLANGGPANGMCTLPCDTDSVCLEISSTSYCVGISTTESYCLPACTVGPLGVPKCQQRPDVACTLIGLIPTGPACETSTQCAAGQLCSSVEPSQCGDIVTGCVPTCGGDFDCAAGQFCDYGTGMCSNTEPEGLPIGAACTPPATEADVDPCQGFCLSSDEAGTVGTCTAFCTFSPTFTGCGWDGVAKAEAGCLYSTILAQGGMSVDGDVGICGSLCDCNSDCALDSERCVDENMGVIKQLFDRQGYCRPLAAGETEADSFAMCPGGAGTGGTGGSGDAGQGGA